MKLAIDELRKTYPPGTKIRLLGMEDFQSPPPNTIGVVEYIDDAGTIHTHWETGSSLGLIYGVDQFEKID